MWPDGRTSYRFKNALRRKVTIIGKTAFKLNKDSHLVPQNFVGSEANYKETVDEEENTSSAPQDLEESKE